MRLLCPVLKVPVRALTSFRLVHSTLRARLNLMQVGLFETAVSHDALQYKERSITDCRFALRLPHYENTIILPSRVLSCFLPSKKPVVDE